MHILFNLLVHEDPSYSSWVSCRLDRKEYFLGSQEDQNSKPAPFFKRPWQATYLSEPQFAHLQNGDSLLLTMFWWLC